MCVCNSNFVSVTHLNFNILSILLCSPCWRYQQTVASKVSFCLCLHQSEAFWSLCLLLRSVLTCNQQAAWFMEEIQNTLLNDYIHSKCVQLRLCVTERCKQQNILFLEAAEGWKKEHIWHESLLIQTHLKWNFRSLLWLTRYLMPDMFMCKSLVIPPSVSVTAFAYISSQ